MAFNFAWKTSKDGMILLSVHLQIKNFANKIKWLRGILGDSEAKLEINF